MTRFLFPLLLSLLSLPVFAQTADTLRITLDDAIIRARAKSVNAAVALNQLRQAYWEYRSYRADLLPEVNFQATVPAYYKQYSTYQNDKGEFEFVRNHYMDISGTLSVTQNIWATGGTISLGTSVDFLRQFSGSVYSRFMSIPVALTLNQPIFAANTVKWNRRIEPLRFTEAKAEFMSASEEVAMTAISYFFNLLSACESLDIARQNLAQAERLHEVAKVKREMGQISGNDLLQMELNELDARSTLTSAESDMKSCMFQLQSFLDFGDDVWLLPDVPGAIPDITVVYSDVLDKALSNNKFATNIRRRQLEADYEVAQAKGDMRRIDIFAQVGFTGVGNEFGGAYNELKDNQVVEIGVRVPLLDWGRRSGKVKAAESNRRVVESNLRLESQQFAQDIFILVERFNNQRQQLDIAARADDIAARRYATNVETYLIGKISTLDLNDSRVKKDESHQAYIQQLYLYWYYYYQLRSLTLWDWSSSTPILTDIEKIIHQP